MDAWESVCGVTFREVADSANADVRIGWQPYRNSPADDKYETDREGGYLGKAWTWWENSTITKTSIAFDPEEPWNTRNGPLLYDTALHEIGHVLGIGHSNVSGVVMSGLPFTQYADPNPNGRDSLQPDDIAGALALWPEENVPVLPPMPEPEPPRATDGDDTLKDPLILYMKNTL